MTPRKVAERVKLGEPAAQGEPPILGAKLSELVESFFRDLMPPRLESAEVLRKAIARGVAEGTFAYTSGSEPVLGANGKFQVSREKVVLGRQLAEDEVDFESGFLMVPAAVPDFAAPPAAASQAGLEPSAVNSWVAPTSAATPAASPQPSAACEATTSLPSGSATDKQTVVRIRFTATREQIFQAFPALANSADGSDGGRITVHVEGLRASGFDPVWLRNAVVEPLSEADIEPEPN